MSACAEKSSEEVELLELDASGMHVAEYMTQLPPKEMLQGKLHAAIEKAKEKFEYKENTAVIDSIVDEYDEALIEISKKGSK